MRTTVPMPGFLQSFKDPRFLLTLIAIMGTALTAYYRLGQVEHVQSELKRDLDVKVAGIETNILDLKLRIADVETKAKIAKSDYDKQGQSLVEITTKIDRLNQSMSATEMALKYIGASLEKLADKIDK